MKKQGGSFGHSGSMLAELRKLSIDIHRMDPNLAERFVINQGEKSVIKKGQLSTKERVYLMLLNGRLNCLGEP